MVGCQVVHTNISTCSTFLLGCTTVGLAILRPCAKSSCAAAKLSHVDTPQVFGGGPHASKVRPNMGCQSGGYDHLRRRHIGWIVMAHHERHCGRLIYL